LGKKVPGQAIQVAWALITELKAEAMGVATEVTSQSPQKELLLTLETKLYIEDSSKESAQNTI